MNTYIISLLLSLLPAVVLAMFSGELLYQKVSRSEATYLVAVYYGEEYFAAGALLTAKHVLTADLRSLQDEIEVGVYTGVHELKKPLYASRHPAVRRHHVDLEDIGSIGIAELGVAICFTNTLQSIPLFKKNLPRNAKMNVVGWSWNANQTRYDLVKAKQTLVEVATDDQRLLRTTNLDIESFDTKLAFGVLKYKLLGVLYMARGVYYYFHRLDNQSIQERINCILNEKQ